MNSEEMEKHVVAFNSSVTAEFASLWLIQNMLTKIFNQRNAVESAFYLRISLIAVVLDQMSAVFVVRFQSQC